MEKYSHKWWKERMKEDKVSIEEKKEYLWSIGFYFPAFLPKRLESFRKGMFPWDDKYD